MREKLFALARLIASADGFQLQGAPRAFESTRGDALVWRIQANLEGTGTSAQFVIDDRSGVVLNKEYIGFRRRHSSEAREFHGNIPRYDSSIIERELFLPAARSAVFAYLADLHNVAEISKPQLEMASAPTGKLEKGTVVAWRGGSSFGGKLWRVQVDELVPDERIDESQIEGPFARFRHLLVFLDTNQGTLLRERLEYRARGGAWGELRDMIFGAQRAIEKALESRYAALSGHFGPPWPPVGQGPDG